MRSDADIIAAHQWRKYDDNCRCGDPITFDEHPVHVAAMLRDNRTLRTVEDIAALPDGTEIRFHDPYDGYPMGDEIHTVTNGLPAGFDKGGLRRWLDGMYAIVIWHPGHDRQQR